MPTQSTSLWVGYFFGKHMMINNHEIALPKAELEQLLERAALRGARAALTELNLEGEDAAQDIRELRSLLEAFTLAKRTAWQTAVKMITASFLLALVMGAMIKLKLFGET